MNKRLTTTLLAGLLCAITVAPLCAKPSTVAERKDEAASLYDNGEYSAAYKQYLKLAKEGDTFAQYRVSFMKLKGLGTREKVSEAMAWAVVASKSGDADLVSYRNAVAELVPVKKRKSAERKANSYLRRWGPEDESADDSTPVGASGVECTGSRLYRNCYSQAPKTMVRISWSEDHSADSNKFDNVNEYDQIIVEKSSILN